MVVRNINLSDVIKPKVSKRITTPEGYMRVPGYAARSGIQTYSADEMGILGSEKSVWRVYRPPEEVFSQDSLDTYGGADITLGHPPYNLSPSTFRNHTAGSIVSPGVEDNGYVKVDLLIKDEQTIEAISRGTLQLSAGYISEMDDNVPVGAGYDLIQRAIRINHVAVVENGRAGDEARIHDGVKAVKMDSEVKGNKNKTYYFEDNNVTEAFDATMKEINKLSKKIDLIKDAEEEEKKKKEVDEAAEEEKKKEEDEASEEEEKKKENEEKIKDAVLTRDAARRFVGDSYDIFSTDAHKTRLQILQHRFPTRNWVGESKAYVRASFDILTEKQAPEVEAAESNGIALHPSSQNLAKGLMDSSGKFKTTTQDRETAYLTELASRGDV